MDIDSGVEGVRLDIWLWAARFFKTRSLAKQAIAGGKIQVNEASAKPARGVRVGDRVEVVRGIERMKVHVLGLSSQRGPASQAQALYEEFAESRDARERMREMRRLTGAGLDHPASRPDKHSRRQLREMKEGAR